MDSIGLKSHGHIPLPPYIKREDEAFDKERYQTVFAKNLGAVAAPTAGLHFDDTLLQTLQNLGVQIEWVTLHVGAGTFLPIKTEDWRAHRMHQEFLNISSETAMRINAAKKAGKRIIAVGTTSVRAMETANREGVLIPYQGETDIFIYPGFSFRIVDALITNFHLPQSTLLLLVSAFASWPFIKRAYQEAIESYYRLCWWRCDVYWVSKEVELS